jgi:hypothetical protein
VTDLADRLRGQNRIEADRMWRSTERRKEFEAETGLTDEHSEAYQSGFIEWALRRITA